MSNDTAPRQTSSAARALQIIIVILSLVVVGALVYGLVRSADSPTTTVVLGAVGSLITFLVSKNYEFRKQREAKLAEKKRTVYRSLLTPWERVFGDKGKTADETLTPELRAAAFGGAFDTVLYGSESVIRSYADLRAPQKKGDPVEYIRALGALLIAMREDVTGEKSDVPEEVVLRMFANLTPEQMAIIMKTKQKD